MKFAIFSFYLVYTYSVFLKNEIKIKPDQRSQKKKASKNEKEIKPLQNSK